MFDSPYRPYVENMTIKEAQDLLLLPLEKLLATPIEKINYAVMILTREALMQYRPQNRFFVRREGRGMVEVPEKTFKEEGAHE